jgi:hypothetical protein
MTLANRDIPESVIEQIPESVARENEIIAIEMTAGVLTIAYSPETSDKAIINRIEFILARKVVWEPHDRKAILHAIDRHYGRTGRIDNCEIEFRYQCPQRWLNLVETPDPMIRYCSVCERSVYFCDDAASAVGHAKLGRCIAIADDGGAQLLGDLAIDPGETA